MLFRLLCPVRFPCEKRMGLPAISPFARRETMFAFPIALATRTGAIAIINGPFPLVINGESPGRFRADFAEQRLVLLHVFRAG